MTQGHDLGDPAHPVKIRDVGLPGQEPGSTGAVPTELHGMISTGPAGTRVFVGHGTDTGGMLQIVDRTNTGLHILELTGPAREAAGQAAIDGLLASNRMSDWIARQLDGS